MKKRIHPNQDHFPFWDNETLLSTSNITRKGRMVISQIVFELEFGLLLTTVKPAEKQKHPERLPFIAPFAVPTLEDREFQKKVIRRTVLNCLKTYGNNKASNH
jgi:hypothetical protein